MRRAGGRLPAGRGPRRARSRALRARGRPREGHRAPRHQAGESLPPSRRQRSVSWTSGSRVCAKASRDGERAAARCSGTLRVHAAGASARAGATTSRAALRRVGQSARPSVTLLSGHSRARRRRTANEQLILAATRRSAAPRVGRGPFIAEEVAGGRRSRCLVRAGRSMGRRGVDAVRAPRGLHHALTSSSVETAPRLAVPERPTSYPDTEHRHGLEVRARDDGSSGRARRSRCCRRLVENRCSSLPLRGSKLVLSDRRDRALICGATAIRRPRLLDLDLDLDLGLDLRPRPRRNLRLPADPRRKLRLRLPIASASAAAESVDALPPAALSSSLPASSIRASSCSAGRAPSRSMARNPRRRRSKCLAGDHLVTCRTPPDRPQKQSIHVNEGEERTVTFTVASGDPRGRRK